LEEILRIPVFYMLIGKAQSAFPNSATPAPSSFVQIIPMGKIEAAHRPYFPAYVNWQQWEDVVVPLLSQARFPEWLGSTGGQTGTTSDGFPGVLYDISVGPGIYSCNEGLLRQYEDLVGKEIKRLAEEAGYGC